MRSKVLPESKNTAFEVSITGSKGVLFSIAGGEDLTMFEIQDAAKVITESIDPEAKIIFGTVRDDKLKKNEIKITVIATGFPESNTASPRTSSPVSAEPTIASIMKSAAEKGDRGERPERGKIFNTMSDVKRDAVPEKKVEKEEKKDDDDDWGAIPAFLRRSKLK
jgi:cell division protein FtsZ